MAFDVHRVCGHGNELQQGLGHGGGGGGAIGIEFGPSCNCGARAI